MADDLSKQAIIIKKVVKGGHASHGGAWKIAYADFVKGGHASHGGAWKIAYADGLFFAVVAFKFRNPGTA